MGGAILAEGQGVGQHSGLRASGVSILCQHYELPDGTIRQKGDDVDASKLLKLLQT